MDAARVAVAVVVDHRAVRAWLCGIVERHPALALCGTAATIEDAVTLVAARRPEVVVLDDRLAGVPAVVACRRPRSGTPPPSVLFLSSIDDEDAVVLRLLSGAAGVVLRGDPDDVVAARVIGAARPWPDDFAAADAHARVVLAQRLARRSSGEGTPAGARLLALVVEGCTDGEIGGTLRWGPAEVQDGVLDLLARLHLDGTGTTGRAVVGPRAVPAADR